MATVKLDRVYVLVIILGAISISALAFTLTAANNKLDDQADALARQVRLTQLALLAECETRGVVRALAQQTVNLLASQPSTRETREGRQTIAIFRGYVFKLSNTTDCSRLRQAILEGK